MRRIKIEFQFQIDSSINQVWSNLVNETTKWWSKDFYSSPKTRAFHIEAKPGGRMYEDYGNNEGMVWADVLLVDSPRIIEFKGNLSPQFGGPAFSYLRLAMEENGNSTIMNVSDHVMGAVDEESQRQIAQGWQMIFEEAFKNYVENK